MGDYNEIWFANTRVQTTNLKRWILWSVLLIVFCAVATAVCVKSFYRPIESYEIKAESPAITVKEAKQTNANGYIKGTVKNNTDAEIKGKYIEFDFYTKNNVEIGKEYVEIGTLDAGEEKTYEDKFKYPNLERFVLTISYKK